MSLDSVLTNTDELLKEAEIGGCLGCSNHALVEFMTSRNMGLAKSKDRALNF